MYADRIYNQREGKHDPIYIFPIPFLLPHIQRDLKIKTLQASKLTTTSCIRLVHRSCLKERFAIESDIQGDLSNVV